MREESLTSKFEKVPLKAAYQYAKSEGAPDWVKVLKPGTQIMGTYTGTYTNPETSQKTHYFDSTEGRISVSGRTVLNNAIAKAKPGDSLRVTYKGLGKRVPGRKPPHLFDVTRLTNEA